MAKMRAVQVARAGGPLELVEREMSEPARGEVRGPDYAEPAAWPVRRCLPSIRPCGIIRRAALCKKLTKSAEAGPVTQAPDHPR